MAFFEGPGLPFWEKIDISEKGEKITKVSFKFLQNSSILRNSPLRWGLSLGGRDLYKALAKEGKKPFFSCIAFTFQLHCLELHC